MEDAKEVTKKLDERLQSPQTKNTRILLNRRLSWVL